MTVEIKERPTMTVREVAEYLGVSKFLVYDKLCTGEIPSKKLGSRWIISRSWVINFVEHGDTTPITQR